MKPAYGDLSQKPGITKVYAHPYWCVKISGEGGWGMHWEHSGHCGCWYTGNTGCTGSIVNTRTLSKGR